MPLVTLDHISVAFGHLPLLDDASLTIDPKERSRPSWNQALSASRDAAADLSGEVEPDAGSVWRQPG